MSRKFLKIVVVGIVAAILPLTALAQFNTGGAATLSQELGVEVVPSYPAPHKTVFISLTLYTDDLNSADISWYRDGKLEISGKGATRHSFVMGPAGTETSIEIKVKLLSGSSFSKTINFNPASVDLAYEANSYVPPFYKGRALHSPQGSLKVVAIPEFIKDGRRILPQNLVYEWSNGVSVYDSQSGYGRNVLNLNGSLLGRAEEIELLVTDPVNNLAASGFININPTAPEIVFYENSPYYGQIFDQAVPTTFDLKSDELQVWAAPYYFSREQSGNLRYAWRLNNASVPALSESRTAIFRKPEEGGGASNIALSIENINRVLQQASASLTIKFEE